MVNTAAMCNSPKDNQKMVSVLAGSVPCASNRCALGKIFCNREVRVGSGHGDAQLGPGRQPCMRVSCRCLLISHFIVYNVFLFAPLVCISVTVRCPVEWHYMIQVVSTPFPSSSSTFDMTYPSIELYTHLSVMLYGAHLSVTLYVLLFA